MPIVDHTHTLNGRSDPQIEVIGTTIRVKPGSFLVRGATLLLTEDWDFDVVNSAEFVALEAWLVRVKATGAIEVCVVEAAAGENIEVPGGPLDRFAWLWAALIPASTTDLSAVTINRRVVVPKPPEETDDG